MAKDEKGIWCRIFKNPKVSTSTTHRLNLLAGWTMQSFHSRFILKLNLKQLAGHHSPCFFHRKSPRLIGTSPIPFPWIPSLTTTIHMTTPSKFRKWETKLHFSLLHKIQQCTSISATPNPVCCFDLFILQLSSITRWPLAPSVNTNWEIYLADELNIQGKR